MRSLRPEAMGILEQVEEFTGRPVEFKPDSSLTLRVTLQMARNGAPAHILRYRPSNEPIDYWVAHQAAYALRLVQLPTDKRFDFAGTGDAANHVQTLLKTGRHLTELDKKVLPQFAQMTAHRALMNLRLYATGMRIDQWLADKHPALRELQATGMDEFQQENLLLLSKRVGNLSVPVSLLAPVAAYAMFADRLLGKSLYAIPYRAAGVLALGKELIGISDTIPDDPAHDCELVDAWASAIGMSGWYAWTPYKP